MKGKTKTMNKKELADCVAKNVGVSQTTAMQITNEIFDVIADRMEAGEKVQIIGFGTFDIKQMSAKEGRNPRTGEKVHIPAHSAPAFRPGKQLKDRVSRAL